VLLCAMGSLILLLLVIDRRAKAVARAKAQQALERVREEEESARAARAAEWERRRQALRARLLNEDQGIVAQVRAVQGQTEEAEGRLRGEGERRRALAARLGAERALVRRGEEETAAERLQLGQKGKETEASRADLERLAKDLHGLEQTLADLKAARQRE